MDDTVLYNFYRFFPLTNDRAAIMIVKQWDTMSKTPVSIITDSCLFV
jgi:hypothetical protein